MLPDLSSISLTSWAGIMAAGALIGTCWSYVRAGLNWFTDLFICRIVVKEETSRAVMVQIWRKGIPSPFGTRLFGGITSFVAPKRRVEVVPYEGVMSDPRLFWFGRIPMVIKVGMVGNDSPNIGYQSSAAMPCFIWFIRGTVNVDELLSTAVTEYNQVKQAYGDQTQSGNRISRFSVVRMHGNHGESKESGGMTKSAQSSSLTPHNGDTAEVLAQLRRGEIRSLIWKPDDLVERPSEDRKPFVCHPIPTSLLAEFDEIHTWLRNEQWFKTRGIPWRRGYLLASSPGAGKDTLVRNLAVRHDLPIYAFDLSTYNNASFVDGWKSVMQNAPAIALLSDIDGCFVGRENVAVKDKQRDGLTFDCLLNTISGVGSSDGVLLFITTNHLESVDPAIGIPTDGSTKSTRPGRIDKVIRMGPMEEPERRKLAHIILESWPEHIEPTVTAGEGEMAAQFQDRCAQLGLKLFWEKGLSDSVVVEEPTVKSQPIESPFDRLEDLFAVSRAHGRVLEG